MVKVDFVIDINKFRQTSCGVQFFYSEYDEGVYSIYSLLKNLLESRLFVGRISLGDCQLQENTMGAFREEAV